MGTLLIELVIALCAALLGAVVALGLRQPTLIGYVLAGVVIGPFTPGIRGEPETITQLAEIGIVLLMFVVGVQLPLRELLRAGRFAVFGAGVQVSVMIGIGWAVGKAFGWGNVESYLFGAVVSNSSSTVLSKVLGERGELDSQHAQLSIAWSSVQDISTVALIAIAMALSPGDRDTGWLLAKAALFFCVLVPLGFFVLPWVLRRVSQVRSREFFSLAVVTLALSMAAIAGLLGVSLALGAFLAGIVIGESDVAHRVLGDAIPLRDVFSGLFFVSIGMLLDPSFVIGHWWVVLVSLLLIIGVKGAISSVLAAWLGSTARVAVLVGAALAQSAEFSFLMARIGLSEGVLSNATFNVLLSAAVLSVVLSPAVNALAPRAYRWFGSRRPERADRPSEPAPGELSDHAIVCGHGRVGRVVTELLAKHGKPFIVIEEDLRLVDALRERGVPVLFGDCGQPHVLDRAFVARARLLVLCIPERMATRRAVEYARQVRPELTLLARTHSTEDCAYLTEHGVSEAVLGETELALQLGRRALTRFDVDPDAIERAIGAERGLSSVDGESAT